MALVANALRMVGRRAYVGHGGLLGLCFGIGVLLGCTAFASTVRDVDFDEAVSRSELVFEGTVVSRRESISPNTGQPFTYFTFQIREVIKGSYAESTITLGYMGGTKNGYVLSVTDMRMPEVGEHGIYFVESLSRQQVHPLYGWQQWHLIVYRDAADGAEKVRHVEPKRSFPAAPSVQTLSLDQIKRNIRSVPGGRR